MLLQQLVDHFNDKFVQEQKSSFRPFILQDGVVSGLFGKSRINSVLAPIRDAYNQQLIVGHSAQTITIPSFFYPGQTLETKELLSREPPQPQRLELSAIINFDRLCRTVHLLNSLAVRERNSFLLLDVDPRHVMSIKHSHGAYFEEIITQCGLDIKNMVISLAADGIHYAHHLEGLNNYRQCGYKIALNVGHLVSADKLLNLIKTVVPDYVRVIATNDSSDSSIIALDTLQKLVTSLGGRTIFQNVQHVEQAVCSSQIGFDLVQGSYYEEVPDNTVGYSKSCVKNYSYIT